MNQTAERLAAITPAWRSEHGADCPLLAEKPTYHLQPNTATLHLFPGGRALFALPPWLTDGEAMDINAKFMEWWDKPFGAGVMARFTILVEDHR